MKLLVAICALALLATGSAMAAGKAMKEQELIDLETTWSKAIVAKDTATIASIVADDWTGQNDSGKPESKADFLADVKSGALSVTSMHNHDVSARIVRGVGIVQGADDEKSAYKGKDTSGSYTWMDVFVNREGTWQAIASQVTKVKRMK